MTINRRPLKPMWLAHPSRFAAVSPTTARWALALLGLLLAATLLAYGTPGPPPVSHQAANRAEDQADAVLYETIVENVRHGGDYYVVTADALRRGNYPLRPFVTFRLPTLAVAQAHMPPMANLLLLYVLAAAVVVAWYRRLVPVFSRGPPRLIAVALLAGGLMAFVQPDLVAFHEIWAGLFIALSAALWSPGRWVSAAAFGLCAALIRETAALYLAVMIALALVEGDRREAGGWLLAVVVVGAALGLHAHAVGQVVRDLDPASPGWSGLLGFGFFVQTMAISTALELAPLWLAAPLVGLALFGWAAWRDPTALRILATICAVALVLAVFGRTDTFYWGFLVAPPMLVGLAFVPDAVRDLVSASLDRRRITVTRVVR